MRFFNRKETKETLWCGFEASVGYNEHLHPYRNHQKIEDFKDGAYTCVDICHEQETYRVTVIPYQKI